MESTKKVMISIKVEINAPIEKVWKCWTTPEDIVQWNNASPDWHTPTAENNLHTGGKFSYRMEAKDGSMGFDFWGIYNAIIKQEKIAITLGDDRKMAVVFNALGNITEVLETFEAEDTNPIELQRNGWQAILNNFKKHTESNNQ